MLPDYAAPWHDIFAAPLVCLQTGHGLHSTNEIHNSAFCKLVLPSEFTGIYATHLPEFLPQH